MLNLVADLLNSFVFFVNKIVKKNIILPTYNGPSGDPKVNVLFPN